MMTLGLGKCIRSSRLQSTATRIRQSHCRKNAVYAEPLSCSIPWSGTIHGARSKVGAYNALLSSVLVSPLNQSGLSDAQLPPLVHDPGNLAAKDLGLRFPGSFCTAKWTVFVGAMAWLSSHYDNIWYITAIQRFAGPV